MRSGWYQRFREWYEIFRSGGFSELESRALAIKEIREGN